MPYRARGKWIQVKRGSKWVRHRRAASAGSAKKRATAMNLAHVRKGAGSRRRRRRRPPGHVR